MMNDNAVKRSTDFIDNAVEKVLSHSNAGRDTSAMLLAMIDKVSNKRIKCAVSGSPVLYEVILAVWVLLCAGLAGASYPVVIAAFHRSAVTGVLASVTVAFVAYFWLNGVKDVAYPIAYRLMTHRSPPYMIMPAYCPSVAILYVTCNDFSAASLDSSAQQTYPRCEVFILDDSYKSEYKRQVDEYAQRRGYRVVRRVDRSGYKAGNLNNFLRDDGQRFDFFVIVDSDEILPPDFTRRCLDYFMLDSTTGIVQANHVATRNRTTFMRTFAPGVDSHWPAYQAVKARYGFMSLLGHGAMVSLEAYNAAGGFPHIVAEDISFAISVKKAGYKTAFAMDITCEEEFPPDYAAFKKRHKKWTEGNMEFIRNLTGPILFTKSLTWYEKLDIVLFTYSLPLTGLFSLYVIINAIVFPLMSFQYRYPLWMLVPTIVFLMAPMVNDVLTYRRSHKLKLLSYLAHSIALFGSMYFISVMASMKTVIGKSVFHVTPKVARDTSFKSAIWHNRLELCAGTVLTAVVTYAAGSVLPVILLVVPAVFSVYLFVMNAGDQQNDDDKHTLQEKD